MPVANGIDQHVDPRDGRVGGIEMDFVIGVCDGDMNGVGRQPRKISLEPGTRYAILTTQAAPRPDKKTGKLPAQEEQDRWERVIPIMNELLEAKGLTKVAEGAVLVTGMKGPLEEGWQNKVAAFADKIMSTAQIPPGY